MHQKVVLVDDYVSSVGSANFDNRSFRLNFEITSLVYDKTFCSEVEAMFERDFALSRKMIPGESRQKPLPFQVASKVARLAAPVL